MSQRHFAALMGEFAASVGLDWRGKERHNRAVFRFDGTEVEFKYSAARKVLFLKSQLWKIDPGEDRALCLCLLNINGISRYMVALSADSRLSLRHRIMLIEQVGVARLHEELRAFLKEITHLHKIFSSNRITDFLADGKPARQAK